uniref:Secreted protein n=1 Tax=Globodera pallida TaxID=36090 RepID=A0A183C0M2_GLOPA
MRWKRTELAYLTGMVFILLRGSWSICRRSALRCSGQLHELGFEASPSGSGTRAVGVLFVLGAECVQWQRVRVGLSWWLVAVACDTCRHVCASHWELKTQGRNESEGLLAELMCDLVHPGVRAQHSPVPIACDGAETERTR